MSAKLREIQSALIHDIYSGERTSVQFLDKNISAARLDIYYNNTLFGLTDILANAYPVLKKIVGDEFLKTIARFYIKAHPQPGGNRHTFGADLPAFLKSFAAAQSLPYLPDIAAIEWAHFIAELADDASVINFNGVITQLSQNPDFVLRLHPAVSVVSMNFNALDIWTAHQTDNVPEIRLIENQNTVLVWRNQDDIVLLQQISPAMEKFITACRDNQAFAVAMADIGDDAESFQAEFAKAVSSGIFIQ